MRISIEFSLWKSFSNIFFILSSANFYISSVKLYIISIDFNKVRTKHISFDKQIQKHSKQNEIIVLYTNTNNTIQMKKNRSLFMINFAMKFLILSRQEFKTKTKKKQDSQRNNVIALKTDYFYRNNVCTWTTLQVHVRIAQYKM